ncbi:MAG: 50S ribosomal protein L18 [Candidatus Nanoarchaeia archaeon]
MAIGPRYAVRFRRRIEGRTDYGKRIKLLQSKMPRLVVRKSNKYITVQLVEYAQMGDRTLVTAHSSKLKEFGWQHGAKNIPAAYLTGLLAGKLAKQKKITEAVLDIGLHISTKGAKIFAALKGAVDAGLKINYNPEILPSPDRILGKHVAEHLKKQNLPADFNAVKERILK